MQKRTIKPKAPPAEGKKTKKGKKGKTAKVEEGTPADSPRGMALDGQVPSRPTEITAL